MLEGCESPRHPTCAILRRFAFDDFGRRLVAEGAAVVVNDIDPEPAAETVALSNVSAFTTPAAESCSMWAWLSTPPGAARGAWSGAWAGSGMGMDGYFDFLNGLIYIIVL